MGGYSWCATSVDDKMEYVSWDYCDEKKCAANPTYEGSKEMFKPNTQEVDVALGSTPADPLLELHDMEEIVMKKRKEQEEELRAMRRTNKALRAALESLAN